MEVGIMRVLVDETAMLVWMAVRFAVRIGRPMRMPMVRVVDMPVLVKERFVHMLVLMFFGKMQIHARRHISAAAAITGHVMGSPSKGTAIAAPIKGAVEKYAPVRAAPR
jgi:hypothetical protein